MRNPRKRPPTDQRRWYNMCQSSNDIDEIKMIAQIQEHPRKDVFILCRLFAGFYSEYNATTLGIKMARLTAMSKMLKAMDHVGEHWNHWRKA